MLLNDYGYWRYVLKCFLPRKALSVTNCTCRYKLLCKLWQSYWRGQISTCTAQKPLNHFSWKWNIYAKCKISETCVIFGSLTHVTSLMHDSLFFCFSTAHRSRLAHTPRAQYVIIPLYVVLVNAVPLGWGGTEKPNLKFDAFIPKKLKNWDLKRAVDGKLWSS